MNNVPTNQLRWLWLSAMVLLVDQASKWLIQQNLLLYQFKKILPFLNLTLSHNSGAAFGFLNQEAGWQRWIFTLIAIVISCVILYSLERMDRRDNWTACGMAFILGGALGNVYDRFIHGYVIDFIDFHTNTWHFATFNLADSTINVGVAIWLIGIYKKSRENPANSR